MVQSGFRLEGGRVGPFNGDEQKHKIQAAFLEVLVVFVRQSFDVVAQGLHVLLERGLLHVVVFRVDEPIKRHQTHLGINDQLLSFGKV